MNQFVHLNAGMRFLHLSAASALGVLSLLSADVLAQRVQFPTPAQPVQMTMPPPTFGGTVSPPPPTYSTTPFPSSPYAAPAYSPAAVGPPPAFDPYASGGSVAPPPALPYSYTPPPPAAPITPLSPPPPPATFPDGTPVYQPPPIATSTEGYWTKTQRFLQEMEFEYTFLYGDHTDPNDFGVNRVELSSTFAFPMFYNIESPLLVTPGFAFNFFSGPLSGPPIPGPPVMAGGPDLPAQVYDAYLDFAWFPRCYEWLGGEFGFRPGVFTDFENVNSDSLRLLGRALGSVSVSPNLDVLLGVVYLDRVDVKLLPAGGVYYRPTPEWDMYLVFPNPKVRKYFTNIGNSKWFWFLAGEYGGGSWTVERQTTDDRIDYNDIRFSGGVEWETQTFIRGNLEIGYVWDREIIFVSGDPPEFRPDDTFMIRAGIEF